MKHKVARYGAKLSLVVIIGISLGLLIWQLVGFHGWTTNTVWVVNSAYSTAMPILAIAATGNLVVNALLLLNYSTRSFGAKWIATSVILWLVTSCVVFAVYRYYGPVHSNLMSFLAGSVYLGGAVSFGFIIFPLYLLTVTQAAIRKLGPSSPPNSSTSAPPAR